jgi:hypothetical protein
MLAPITTVAIALLLTLGGVVAVLAIADSVLKARHAYRQLMREAALLNAGFVPQIEARDQRLRRGSVQAMPARRLPVLRPLPAFAAA